MHQTTLIVNLFVIFFNYVRPACKCFLCDKSTFILWPQSAIRAIIGDIETVY